MKIIAHRGLWEEPSQKNTEQAFKAALDHGFGIETDVRDLNGKLVISHDIPRIDAMAYADFVSLVNHYPPVNIAMNIKADGLQDLLKQHSYIEGTNLYYFDMSVPDTLGYKKRHQIFYTRYSDIEPTPSLLQDAKGVWLDNFNSNELAKDKLVEFITLGKEVTLVSPELHSYDYNNYWTELKQVVIENALDQRLLSLCTDYPILANEFFNE